MTFDWASLHNPVLAYGDWSIKDACAIERQGTCHLFFSVFDRERSGIAGVRTRDMRTFSDFTFLDDGRQDGFIGLCSPDVMEAGGRYYLSFNSWGDDPASPNRLFYMVSDDLEKWSERRPVAANLTEGVRAIDVALANDGRRWFAIWKSTQSKTPHIATAQSVDGPWSHVGDGRLSLLTGDGTPNGMIHENFQFIRLDGRWRLVSTDYSPHHAWLYTMAGDGSRVEDWQHWTEGYRLAIPGEGFNTVDMDNAGAFCRWDDNSGWRYFLYAGKGEERRDEFCGTAARAKPWPRGWNRLALARSRDLKTWLPAGK